MAKTVIFSDAAMEFIIAECNNANIRHYENFCNQSCTINRLQQWKNEWKENFDPSCSPRTIDEEFVNASIEMYDTSEDTDEEIDAEIGQAKWEAWWKAFWGIQYRVFPKALNS